MTATLAKNDSKKEIGNMHAEMTREGMTFVPRFDIWETDDELVLYGDLPGVKSEHVDINFENSQLVIYGKVNPRHPERKHLYAEYGVGDFHRSFTIGEMIDASKITAELSGGVLTVHLPKSEAVKPRRIEVKSS